MKKATIIGICLLASLLTKAQTINWASLKTEDRHILNAGIGANYAIVYGLGYGYKLTGDRLPIIANVSYSFPSGKRLFDDYKTSFGGQIRLARVGDFHLAAKVQGVFRRYENDLVRLLNWGTDFSGTIGYYRPRWFVAGEAGFDKAIMTHFKHSAEYKREFPEVKDGWYEPATGGNFHYGLQTGLSFAQHDLYLKGGAMLSEDFKTKPLLPFYLEVGYNYRLK